MYLSISRKCNIASSIGEVKVTKDIIFESIEEISGMLNGGDIIELSKQCRVVHYDEIKCGGKVFNHIYYI